MSTTDFPLFDAHFHVIDPRFPLVPNRGYLPDRYTVSDYRERMEGYDLRGGAVISGSFQAFDQDYLVNALDQLGPAFVGVTQLPASVSEEELRELDRYGVRAVRFNLKRGGSEDISHLDAMARRIHALLGWHVELYADACDLSELYDTLVRVKASGFGRVDFDVRGALKELHAVNPDALMFGTDLPSTRAARPYSDRDFQLVIDTLGETAARRVLLDNAVDFYRPRRAVR
jgi:predicted TIM-barrel fold metal-dependent hydrolase